MGDFSPVSLRCRIDTYGGSILCDFDDELKNVVLGGIEAFLAALGRSREGDQ